MTTPVHTYPDTYCPGTHPFTDKAWQILDTIKPGVIPEDVRAFLAGMITAALMEQKRWPNNPRRSTNVDQTTQD